MIRQRLYLSDCGRQVPQVVKVTPDHEVSTRPMGGCLSLKKKQKIDHHLCEHLLDNLALL